MHRLIAAVLVASCMAFTGCGSKDLTRDKAKKLIEASDMYTVGLKSVAISSDEVNGMMKSGYLIWTCQMLHCGLSVSKKGAGQFSAAHGESNMGILSPAGYSVELPTPLKPKVVEITGITGDTPSLKIVEYTWQWRSDQQFEQLKPLIPSLANTFNDKVPMQLYDDGWRPQWPK